MAFLQNTARVELIQTLSGAPWSMQVFHLLESGGSINVNQAYADGVAAAVDAALTSSNLPAVCAPVTAFSDVRVKNNEEPGQLYFDSEVGVSGGASSELLPRQVSLVCSHRTAVGNLGRNYMWGYGEGASANGRPTTGIINITLAFWNDLRSELIAELGTGGNLCVIRSAGSPLVTSGWPVIETVRTASAQAQGWQSQRRRSDGLDLI